jgi:hypothetical protein
MTSTKVSTTLKVVGGALLGGSAGLLGTALVLGSLEFAIFGAVIGAVATMIGILSLSESAEA